MGNNSVEKDILEFEGIVEDHSNGKFKVKVNDTHTVLATISGKMRMNAVKIIVGDQVRVECSPYDTKMGRITYRVKA